MRVYLFASSALSLVELSTLEWPVDRADELHGKHTLFGRCVGDTIYSVSFIRVPASGDTAVDPLNSRCHEDRSDGYVTSTLPDAIVKRIDCQQNLMTAGALYSTSRLKFPPTCSDV